MTESMSVTSTNVRSLEYDADARELTVNFHSGRSYVYSDVPYEVFKTVGLSQSVGSAVHTMLKDQYEAREV